MSMGGSRDIRDYARIGLVHHMLYPRCMQDPDDHVQTLESFVQRDDIETFDCCLPYGDERRKRLIDAVLNCGKEHVAFAIHLYPLLKLPLSSPVPHEQAQARMIVQDMIEQAAAIGATGLVFASGRPSPQEATPAHYAAFSDFCRWLCSELAAHHITALLEPFDTTFDKRFLYGSTQACVELIESLRPETDNLGIELDLAHVPLMGESFSEAISTVAPYLRRVHLGNCVTRNPHHPRYGDTHPPMGFPAGEIDVPELTGILRSLLQVGFLNKDERGDLILEMTPWPGRGVKETVADSWTRLETAWEMAIG